MTEATIQYYFKIRQTSPQPPGQWVVRGPFDTYEAAKQDRQRSKAWDCEVSTPFSTASKEEAEKLDFMN